MFLLIADFVPQRVYMDRLGEVFPFQIVVQPVFKVVVHRPPPRTIAQVHLLYRAGVAVLVPCRASINAQPLGNAGIGCYPHHSLDSGIVFRARICDHLQALDGIRREMVELRQVVYAVAVYKEHGLPSAHHIVSAFRFSHERHCGQHVLKVSSACESRAANDIAKAVAGKLRHRA